MTTTLKKSFPPYTKVRAWVQQYGRSDVPDQKGAQEFVECETRETVQSLQLELKQIADGKFDERIMDDVLNKRRKAKHKTYQEWAKIMLLWIASSRG